MSFDTSALALAVERIAAAAGDLETRLNAADAKLGDGDTGSMLARLARALAGLDLAGMDDIGAAFTGMGKAAAMATGSSLGTLVATGLMSIGRESKGASALTAAEFADALETACEAMASRGGGEPGQKTVLDSLHAVVSALRDPAPEQGAAGAAAQAAQSALKDFRDRPNLLGRARMYGDRSKGLDDPGMLAVAEVARLIAEA